MPAYRDNPFEPKTNSNVALDDYYDDAPPPNRLSGLYSSSGPSSTSPPNAGRSGGPFNNIPLTVVPGSSSSATAAANTPYNAIGGHNQPWSADSTDDLPTPTAGQQNPFNTPTASRTALAGGMATGLGAGAAYSDMTRGRGDFNASNAGSFEPKLGAYAPGTTWMETRTKSSKRKWVLMGVCLAVVGLIIIAIVVGVVVSKNHKKSNNLSSSSSGSGASSNSSVKQTDPNDPSKFTMDSNLHQSFYGIAYTPTGSQLPDCGNTLSAVIQDVQIMSQLTTRIRLYGADCNQSALVLEAIKQTKVNLTVWLGNYPVPTDNGTAYERQRDVIKSAIQTYGTDHIGGVTVGNEFMLNYVTQNKVSDVNSAAANTGAQILLGNINDTRTMLSGMGVSLQVGNADAGSYFNNEILAAVDYGMANVHPWFANVSAEGSAAWTADFFAQQDVALANSLSNKPKMYIAETGWPTKSSDAGNANNGASAASTENLQIFLDTFICQANNNGTGYFFFEFCDEDWKDKQFGGVEGWWGLFNQDRTLKNVTIPNCQSP